MLERVLNLFAQLAMQRATPAVAYRFAEHDLHAWNFVMILLHST